MSSDRPLVPASSAALPERLWSPAAGGRARTRMGRYLDWLATDRGIPLDDYEAAWQWSVAEPGAFWQSIWDRFEVGEAAPGGTALADARMPGASWFPGTSLNYAQAMLRIPGRAPSDVVIVGRSQTRDPLDLTAAQLREAVGSCRAGLQRLGVRQGDRVAAFLPNIPETIVALLATASLGAIWSSCAPEFGTRAVIDRLAQIEPTLLLTIDGYRYGDRVIDRTAEVAEIRAGLPSLRATVARPVPGPRGGCPATHTRSRRVVLAARRAGAARRSTPSRSTTRCGSCSHRARPGCPSPSSTATAASCSSTSRRSRCTPISARTTGSAGTPRTGWMMWNYLVVRARGRRRRSCCSTATPPRPT